MLLLIYGTGARRRLREPPRGLKWTIYLNNTEADSETKPVNGYFIRQSSTVNQIDRTETDRLAVCHLSPSGEYDALSRLKKMVQYYASQQILRCDLLLSVTQYNIVSSMFANSKIIGLSPELLDLDINSPFAVPFPFEIDLPQSMRPTPLQKQQPHHPWIDLLPIPNLRDSILRHLLPDELDLLCGDLFGRCGKGTGQVGLVVWGESWDSFAYEISETVFMAWAGLLRHCPELVYSTNYWRQGRGEPALDISLLSQAGNSVHPQQ